MATCRYKKGQVFNETANGTASKLLVKCCKWKIDKLKEALLLLILVQRSREE
jgi:hypothetical protein